ncbi:Chymotrypsin-like elastase family member 1 [Collichthys lucidus]|uniref:Chymotrypsin-like elastase family member 1 n=1 Tax=Collichthys lucidus TaxID=240159 RepID=A0A4U5VHE2_COLLU|nr:Chymotrypsin-like elastase family member 1 [Collichthys lucidus]
MIWLVALLSCFGLICAEAPLNYNVHNQRVIGGSNAPHGQWKWQISLQQDAYNDGSYYHLCGGTIIGPYSIMTAAHCILSMDASTYRVVAGDYNLYEYDGSEQFIRVERITIHPGWTGDLANGNDIAILRLADSVYGSSYVDIANLPYPGQTLPHDYQCFISGWGLMDYMGSVPAILQEAMLPVVAHSVCSQPDWWGSVALETMVCAGGDGVVSGCQGDSGGPLNCYTDGAWRVHGVVSYGPAGMCNQVTKPTVFTRVSSFIDWIHSVQ